MGKKGGSPPPAPASTQVVRSEIPEFFRPFLEDIFRRSSAISEEAYIPPPERARLQEVGEETLAPIDPAQQAALDRLKSTEMAETGVAAVRAGQGLTLSGAERVGGEEIREAMNPFQQAVTDIAVREELRRAAPQRQALQAQAARAGAFGGSRGALLEAEFERNLGQRLADIQTTGGAAAFDRATQRLEQERQRQIGAGQALAGLGAQEANVLSAGVGRQLAAGEAQRGLQTEAIGRGLEEFQREVDYPKQQIGFYSGILRGYQPPMNTYQTVSTPFSPTQQFLGQAAAAGAIGKGFGLFNDGGIVGLAFGGAPSQQYTESVGDDKGLSSMVGNPVASYANGGMTRIGSGPNFQVMSQDDLYSLAGRATPDDPNTSALIEEFQRRRLPVPPALGKSMTQSRATAGIGSAPPVIPAPTRVSENIREDVISEKTTEDVTTSIRPPTMAVEVGTGAEVDVDQSIADQKELYRLGAGSDAARRRATLQNIGPTPGEQEAFAPSRIEQSIKTTQENAAKEIGVLDKRISNIDNLAKRFPDNPRLAAERQQLMTQKNKITEDASKAVERLQGLIPSSEGLEGLTDIDLQTSGPVTARERQEAAALDPNQKLVMPKKGKKLPPNMKRKTSETEESIFQSYDVDADPLSEMEQEVVEAKPAAAAPAAAEGEPQEGQRDLTDWFGLAAAALAASTGREEGLTNAAKLLASTQRPEERLLNLTKAQYYGEAGKSDRLKAILKRQTDVEKLKLDYQKFQADILEKDRRFNLDSFKAYPDLYKQVLSIEPQAIEVLGDEDSTAEQKEEARRTIISSLKRAQSGLASGGSVPQEFAQYGVTGIRSI